MDVFWDMVYVYAYVLSACLLASICQKQHVRTSSNFRRMLPVGCGRGWVFLWRHCDMLCRPTSGLWMTSCLPLSRISHIGATWDTLRDDHRQWDKLILRDMFGQVRQVALSLDRWRSLMGWSSPFLRPWTHRWINVCDAWPVRRQTNGYLPTRRASPPFDRY